MTANLNLCKKTIENLIEMSSTYGWTIVKVQGSELFKVTMTQMHQTGEYRNEANKKDIATVWKFAGKCKLPIKTGHYHSRSYCNCAKCN